MKLSELVELVGWGVDLGDNPDYEIKVGIWDYEKKKHTDLHWVEGTMAKDDVVYLTIGTVNEVEATRNIEDDAIEPSHYRKGEIDLFESWYRTRPFNEFRAIMESIAERYMKRDKENRVQDIEKAIYTLTRLKEYEEKERKQK